MASGVSGFAAFVLTVAVSAVLGSPVAHAQGVLLPPGEVLRPGGSIPGATQPTAAQMFSPQTVFAPVAPQQPPVAPSPAAPPSAAPQAAVAPVPVPAPRPASANAAPAAAPSAPLAIAPAQSAAAGRATSRPPFLPQSPAPVQGDQDRASAATLDKVSNYWNAVQMLSGTFVQIDPDGSKKTGDFYMQKPGRVRFEYNAPSAIELVSNGQSVAVRDRKLNTQDITPLSQTPLRFLLAERIDLGRDSHVAGAYQDNLYVTVVMQEQVPMVGTYKLMLLFDARDYTLKQWIVTDPQGYDTSVALSNLDYTRRPDPKLFVINFERMLQ